MAVAHGNKDVFDRLMAHKADLEIGGDQRPLMLALDRPPSHGPAFAGMANDLLDAGARVITEQGEKPALVQAVANGQDTVLVKRLLDAGADPNQSFESQSDENAGTPLHNVRSNRPDVVDLLIDYGANVNAPVSNANPATPLEAAVHSGAPNVAERLIERGADAEPVTQSHRWDIMMRSKRESVRAAASVVESAALSRAAEQTQEQPEDEVAPRRRVRL